MKNETKRARSSAPRRQGARIDTGRRDHDFRVSKRTAAAIDAALHGLTKAQQQRVLAAIDQVGQEASERAGRWVERNVIGNANQLLAFVTPRLARENRWADLRAIWFFLMRFDVPVDHRRVAATLEKEGGPELADRYREEALAR